MDGFLIRKSAAASLFFAAFALAAVVSSGASAGDTGPDLLGTFVGTGGPVGAAGPAPEIVGDVCTKCHGPGGISVRSPFPSLAAQPATYLDTELGLFRDHARSDPYAQAMMWGIARGLYENRLSADQIKAIVDYYSSQPPPAGRPPANPALAAEGKAIYDNGVAANNVPACVTCHEPGAVGKEIFPRLAGQHRSYLVRELKQFRSKLRESDIMQGNVKDMTDQQMEAVAEYLASL
ncbi:MAG: c-type cytochrome [Terriglobia bacterium]